MFIVVNGIHESSKGLPPPISLNSRCNPLVVFNQSLVLLINVANLDTIFELCKQFNHFLQKSFICGINYESTDDWQSLSRSITHEANRRLRDP